MTESSNTAGIATRIRSGQMYDRRSEIMSELVKHGRFDNLALTKLLWYRQKIKGKLQFEICS